MIPPTLNGLPAFRCISALQKFIRRGMEREAMACAVELMHTSKAYHTMLCNRLEIISHEDIDAIASPALVPFVKAACEQSRAWYDPKKLGKARMPIGNAIMMMCRAAKSREADHFQAAIGLASLLEGAAPELPDWIDDQHTYRGRQLKRGIDYFREVSTVLVPAPTRTDAYIEEAYRLWALKSAQALEADE